MHPSFYFLFFLPLLTLSLQSESQRSKTRQACKAGVFDVKVKIDEEKAFEAQFNAKMIKLPSGDHQRGWVFKIGAPSSKVKEVFVQSGEEFYLPYRQVSAFTGNDVVGEGRSISSIFSTDVQSQESKAYSLQIQFQYDPDWEVIPSADFNKILGWLNFNRVERINYVKSLKEKILIQALEYTTNLIKSETSGQDKSKLDSKISEISAQVSSLRSSSSSSQVSSTSLQASLLNGEKEVQTLKSDLSSLEGQLTQLNGKLDSQKGILNELVTSKDNNNLNKDKFLNNARNAMDSIKGLVSVWRNDAGEDGVSLDEAVKELEEAKNKEKFDALVRKALLP